MFNLMSEVHRWEVFQLTELNTNMEPVALGRMELYGRSLNNCAAVTDSS